MVAPNRPLGDCSPKWPLTKCNYPPSGDCRLFVDYAGTTRRRGHTPLARAADAPASSGSLQNARSEKSRQASSAKTAVRCTPNGAPQNRERPNPGTSDNACLL